MITSIIYCWIPASRGLQGWPVVRPSAGLFSERAHGKHRAIPQLVLVKECEAKVVCGIVDEPHFLPKRQIESVTRERKHYMGGTLKRSKSWQRLTN